MEKSLLRIANFAKNNSNYYSKKYSKHEINEIKDSYKLPLSDSRFTIRYYKRWIWWIWAASNVGR